MCLRSDQIHTKSAARSSALSFWSTLHRCAPTVDCGTHEGHKKILRKRAPGLTWRRLTCRSYLAHHSSHIGTKKKNASEFGFVGSESGGDPRVEVDLAWLEKAIPFVHGAGANTQVLLLLAAPSTRWSAWRGGVEKGVVVCLLPLSPVAFFPTFSKS